MTTEKIKSDEHISIVDKRSHIKTQIRQLLYIVNSRYGADFAVPTEEEQLKIYKEIGVLREELKNIS